MAAQAGYSSPVAVFCCLRQSEYSVSGSVTPNKFLTLRKVLFPVETNSPGIEKVCFHETDWKANKEWVLRNRRLIEEGDEDALPFLQLYLSTSKCDVFRKDVSVTVGNTGRKYFGLNPLLSLFKA